MPKELRAESVAQFIDIVREHLGPNEDYERTLWYRGQANASWEPLPVVLRPWFLERVRSNTPMPELAFDEVLHEIEREINIEFHQRSAWLTGRSSTPDTDQYISGHGNISLIRPLATEAAFVVTYFTAQHHGTPTRLLDWSTNSLAALFFAVAEREYVGIDGAVFILHLENLTRTVGKRVEKVAIASEFSDSCQECITRLFRHHRSGGASHVLPIIPDSRTGRILQQGSRFTLHLPGCDSLAETSYRKVVVPAEHKRRIMADLRASGVCWATLFPDLDHLSLEIKSRLGLEPPSAVAAESTSKES